MSSMMGSDDQASANYGYWRSLAEKAGDPEFRKFLENEFPDGVGEASSVSRRRFMQLMGASLALSGAACRWEKDHLLPFAARPEATTPGKTKRYATATEVGGFGNGLLVTAYDGRPIKVEGNPTHPVSGGASDIFAQARILELYDPDRSRHAVRLQDAAHGRVALDDALFLVQAWSAQQRARAGEGLAVLSEASSSPTLRRLRQRFAADLPQGLWVQYEPVSRHNDIEGARLAFGEPLRTHLQLGVAAVIATFDDDLLIAHPAALRLSREFASGRRPKGGRMNRLYAVESRFTPTGAMADHRLPVRAAQVGAVLHAVAAAVAQIIPGAQALAALVPALQHLQQDDVLEAFLGEQAARFSRELASDLVAHRGHSVICVGSGQPPWVHALAHHVNAALGNAGRTVRYSEEPDAEAPASQEALAQLVARMHGGEIETLVMLGGNPVYNAPRPLRFAEALAQVTASIHVSLYRDETSRASTLHLPRAHELESWGDVRAYDGTVSIVQPVIKPIFEAVTLLEAAALVLGEERPEPQRLVRETFALSDAPAGAAGAAGGGADRAWRQALHDGVVAGTAFAVIEPKARRGIELVAPSGPGVTSAPQDGQLEVTIWPDPKLYDGRFANNSWLQELPDFMTKLTWDNAALVSPKTAAVLGVKTGSMLRLRAGAAEVESPVYVMPGQATGSIAVFLGYGRTAAGQVGGSEEHGVTPVGFDVTALRPRQGITVNYVGDVSVIPVVGASYMLAMTQDHHAIDAVGAKGRDHRLGELVRESDLATYASRAHEGQYFKEVVEHPPLESLWHEREYDGARWGMSIDLGSCTGCNACVIACQAENNIPVVGKEQVARGREMHWIRIDRYFKGADPETPQVVQQPVACQQCELAPCEQVCPVAATIHSREGLNDMAYNRCIGTRYCANNCPYKVRRFNYFNYFADLKEPANEVRKLGFNPEVTVRARGVMEKCTYCVQRIQNAKIEAKNEQRPLVDGAIQTACQQVCPTQAIVFGDLSDEKSAVAREHADPRAYFLLGELNIKPRTAFLGRVRNPNPRLA